MLAIPAHGLRAFVRYEKKWSEIPVQIDERDRNGDYVLEHGLPFTAPASSPTPPHGIGWPT